MDTAPPPRLYGLDVARCLALIGMVIVNFDIVMTAKAGADVGLATLLQGKAAALFVVLAGIGLGLSAKDKPWPDTRNLTLRRALFLWIAGTLNMLIFPPDIIHYYAFYFVFGLLFIRASGRVLWAAIVALILLALVMIVGLNFDAGWDWATYDYAGLWTPAGYVRNVFYNGWHPVAPWLAFFLFGLWLSRLELSQRRVQWRGLFMGAAVFITANALSLVLQPKLAAIDAEAAILLSTSPIPAVPLYMLVGGGFALMVAMACLLATPILARLGVLQILVRPGQQTLTLYIAHILIGMGVIVELGWEDTQSAGTALWAAGLFCVVMIIFANLWALRFRRGPLEMVMRRLTR